MSGETLELMLGPNYLGWALLDEPQQQIRACGVRVFREGVDRDPLGGEQSKTELRRIARIQRRQTARRARRKRLLRRALVAAGLLPDVALASQGEFAPEGALASEDDPAQRKRNRIESGPEGPYRLRARALCERLEPHDVGRALLHLSQRRGFFTPRQTDQEQAQAQDTSRLLAEIDHLAAELGGRTLGTFLADLQAAQPSVRLRGRHPRRDMLQTEFIAIWRSQQKFHPDLLTDALGFGRAGPQGQPRAPQPPGRTANLLHEVGLFGLIFFQRPLHTQPSRRPPSACRTWTSETAWQASA